MPVLSAGYLLAYWLPPLLAGGGPSQSGLTALIAALSSWISAHQLGVVLTALRLLAGITVIALVSRRRSPHAPGKACCAPTSLDGRDTTGERHTGTC